MNQKILLIEDEESFKDAVVLNLSDLPVEIVWAQTGAKGIQIYKQTPHEFALVLIDYRLPDLNGSDVCRHLKTLNPEQIFLYTSQYFEKEYLTDQLKTGSHGFIDKTSGADEIRNEVLRALKAYDSELRIIGRDRLEKSKIQMALEKEGFVGRSQIMHSMLKKILLARDSKYPTLLVGETGTGKELAARALVPEGKKLIAISGASFVDRENMLESELFGYVKGAFTDAKGDTPGLVMQAHGNVLFLDELHQLSVAAQAKLLRFLQEMKFRRVGDHSGREIHVDFKLIAAVQPDIKQRLKDGRFLPDLLERVGSLVIEIPGLKDRTEDIELLARKFQDEFNEKRAPHEQKQIRINTIIEMQKYPWPTNVRGLQNAVKRMLTNCKGDIVNPADFRDFLHGDLLAEDLPGNNSTLGEATKFFEKTTIIAALKKSRTRVEAAARLGLPFSNFLRKLTKLEINPDLFLQVHGERKTV